MTASPELMAEYGRGFSCSELTRMDQFAQLFPEHEIVATLSQQLSWSHVHALQPHCPETSMPRCAVVERWDTRLHQALEHAREIAARRLPAGEVQP